jgi:hypothetical protein
MLVNSKDKAARQRDLRRLRMARDRKNQAKGIAVAPTPYTAEIVNYLIEKSALQTAATEQQTSTED